MVSPEDRILIHELMALYGHVVDERQWSRVGDLFVDDVVYDVTDVGFGVVEGTDSVKQFWAADEDRHPLAHHVTNVVVIDGTGDEKVHVHSKAVCVWKTGRTSSFTYRDVVQRCDDGRWRMSERVIALRRPETIPSPT